MTALPSVAMARLPASYEAARGALATCERIDECKEWADKAAAMASYAKQSQDKTLEHTAMRIRSRAIKRCGELLRETETSERGGRPRKNHDGGDIVSKSSAAKDAGLSERQKVTALRVANVPDDEFDDLVESDNPPTVTALAERGKKAPPKPPVDHLQGRSHSDFQMGIKAYGHLERLAGFAAKADPAACARGELEESRLQMAEFARAIEPWLKRIIKECEK